MWVIDGFLLDSYSNCGLKITSWPVDTISDTIVRLSYFSVLQRDIDRKERDLRLFAYIDSGTGSIILQAIIGFVMGASYLVRHKIGAIFGHGRKKPHQKDARAEKPKDKPPVD